MIGSYSIIRAFERNCPNARLSKDEREELWRLITVGMDDAAREARIKMKEQFGHDQKDTDRFTDR